MHLAARNGHEALVELLIRHGANPARADLRGRTALLRAARGNHASIIEGLARHGVGLSHRDGRGATALHVAALHDCLEAVDALLRCGAPANAPGPGGCSALQLAMAARRGRIFERLLSHASGPTYTSAELVDFLEDDGAASYLGPVGVDGRLPPPALVELLLERLHEESNERSQGRSGAASMPLQLRSLRVVCQLLLEGGYDTDSLPVLVGDYLLNLGQLPLTALLHCLAQAVGQTLDSPQARALTVTELRSSPLGQALQKQGLWADYLRAVANLDTLRLKPDDSTPLVFAIGHHNEGLARLLLRLGANVHLPDRSGSTPLHAAARTGQWSLIALLIEHGARDGAPDAEGMRASERAAEHADEALAQRLADTART